MISLSKHIEILLLEHDCVIIPRLGGFIANQIEACYGDKADACFMPPYRTIGFYQHLLVNDGLLVQSYMQVYDASYPDAYKLMEMEVDDVIRQLELDGMYRFEGIGTIRKGIEGNLTFEPCESVLPTPGLYGLCALEVKSAKEVRKEKELLNTIKSTNVLPIQSENGLPLTANNMSDEGEEEKENVTIRLNRRWIDISIAGVVAVLLFFLFSYPSLHNSNPTDTCVAGSLYVSENNGVCAKSDLTCKLNSKNKEKEGLADADKVMKEQETASGKETFALDAEVSSDAETVDNKSVVGCVPEFKEDNDIKKDFVIVLASFVSKNNAVAFIDNLRSEGFGEAEYIKTGKISRIVYSGYSSKSEATDSLKVFRKRNAAFKDAWVLKM